MRWPALRPGDEIDVGSTRAAESRELHIDVILTAGNLMIDAHLAALAISHGATLVSFDNDFARFPNLRWTRPGAPEPTPRTRR